MTDKDGQRWERCNQCGTWVRIQYLWRDEPTEEYPSGQGLCKRCALVHIKTPAKFDQEA